MRFPIIAVTDNGGGQKIPHIVGTDPHDVLELDETTGGIHYLNLHCCESTRKYPGEENIEGFTFVAEDNEWSDNPVIRMVSFEELCEIYLKKLRQSVEDEMNMRRFIREIEQRRAEIRRTWDGVDNP